MEIEKYRSTMDDDLKEGNLEPAYEIFNLYKERVNERIDYVDELLKDEFNYNVDETYQVNREEAAWPANLHEMNEIWRKRVKNDALNLKLSGKNGNSSVETLKSRYGIKAAVNHIMMKMLSGLITIHGINRSPYTILQCFDNFDIAS
jgi:carboxyl-terminal processing protease